LQLQDDERRHIARELHDSAGQLLVALGMNLASIQREAKQLSAKAREACRAGMGLVKELSGELRTISHLLHPPLLDEAGLASAVQLYVEGFAERSKIAVELELSPELGRLSPETETAVFRIVQECLTNIHRHSGSSRASICIVRDPRDVRVEVRDQGKEYLQESVLTHPHSKLVLASKA
jgi:signal transduction histidine kinase